MLSAPMTVPSRLSAAAVELVAAAMAGVLRWEEAVWAVVDGAAIWAVVAAAMAAVLRGEKAICAVVDGAVTTAATRLSAAVLVVLDLPRMISNIVSTTTISTTSIT